MNDREKSREQLLAELDATRRHLASLEAQWNGASPLAAVEESEQRMRLHVEQTPLAVIEWDRDLRVAKWNPAAERIFGYSAADARGRHFSFIVPTEVHDDIGRLWTALRTQRGGTRSTNENITRDGQRILCEWYNTPLVDAAGEVVGFASLAEDITDRTRAEAALRESERRLATVLSNLPGAVYRCRVDADWTIEFLSEGYRELTGYNPSELIGQPGLRHSALIHPDDRPRELAAMQEAIGSRRHYQVEYRLRTASGEEKWVWEQGIGIFAEDGSLEAIEGFTTDVTSRKEAEAALRLAHDELEQRVKERTAELKDANDQLQREMEARHRANAALRRMVMAGDHERRLITYEIHDGAAQQLMAALIHLQAMHARATQPTAPSESESDLTRAIDLLRRAAAELRMLMSRLRTPVLDKFGLPEAIEDLVVQLRSRQGAPQIEYHRSVQFQRLEPTLENALFRIAQEALTNACTHSQTPKIRVRLTQQGNQVILAVQDWGHGFDRTTVTENRFGLEGIRERARLLKGRLQIKSRPGHGTLVRVACPLIAHEPLAD